MATKRRVLLLVGEVSQRQSDPQKGAWDGQVHLVDNGKRIATLTLNALQGVNGKKALTGEPVETAMRLECAVTGPGLSLYLVDAERCEDAEPVSATA